MCSSLVSEWLLTDSLQLDLKPVAQFCSYSLVSEW